MARISPAQGPEETDVSIPENAKVSVSSTPSSRNEAIVEDANGFVVRVYAGVNDCDRCLAGPCLHGKRGAKYPQRLAPIHVKALRRLSKTEVEEYDFDWDGMSFPAYSVVGKRFAEIAEGFARKFNAKASGRIGVTATNSIQKNHGYRLRLNPIVSRRAGGESVEYVDQSNRTQQSATIPVRNLSVVYK